ncbi:MAG: phage late control D family protein [Aquabacterium sp.]
MQVQLPGVPTGMSGLSGLGIELVSRLKAALSIGQATRLIQLDTPLPAGTLVVERFTLHEAVHADEPLWAEIDALSTNAHLELKALMGEQLTLRLMQADGSWRTWHGYVVEAGHTGSDGGLGAYRLVLAAFTHWLKQRRDTRIFQDATSADILNQVLAAYPQAHFRIDVADPGPIHEITTQFRETDWAFATRLMAREGWSWRVDHEADQPHGSADAGTNADDNADANAHAGARAARHTLVIFDQHAQRPDLGPLRFSRPDLRAAEGGGLLAAMLQAFNLRTGTAQDTLTAWAPGQQVGPNAVTLAAWDERQLAGVSASTSADIPLGHAPTLEHYLGQGERRFADGRVGTAQPASRTVAEARAQALMAAHQLQQVHDRPKAPCAACAPAPTSRSPPTTCTKAQAPTTPSAPCTSPTRPPTTWATRPRRSCSAPRSNKAATATNSRQPRLPCAWRPCRHNAHGPGPADSRCHGRNRRAIDHRTQRPHPHPV